MFVFVCIRPVMFYCMKSYNNNLEYQQRSLFTIWRVGILKTIPDDNCNWMLIRNIHWSYKYHILHIAYSSKGIIICESNHPLYIDLIIGKNDWSLFNAYNSQS